MPDTNREQWSQVRARTAEAEMLGEVPNQTWLWRQAKTGEDGLGAPCRHGVGPTRTSP